MNKHIPIIASLRIGIGVLEFLSAIFLAVILIGAGVISNDPMAMNVLAMLATILSLSLLAFAVPNIIGGIGLFRYKNWARYLVLVISVMSLLSIPIGTVVGIYSIWVLLQDETVNLFNQKSPKEQSEDKVE